jgi:hypothetical protein
MVFKTIMSEDIETEQQGQEVSEEETGITSNQASEEEGVEREQKEEEVEEVEVAQDHELKVLPENEEEEKEEILITDATKMPSSKTTPTINKKQLGERKRKKVLPDKMTKVLTRQTVEIDKMALLLQSILKQLKPLKIQSDLIKQLQTQLRQMQKQMSQIQKGIITKKQENKKIRKKERITRR